jgi:hypothetical protein
MERRTKQQWNIMKAQSNSLYFYIGGVDIFDSRYRY